MMKAFSYETPTDGLQLKDLSFPEPDDESVLIEVKAAGICHSDCHIVSGHGDDYIAKKPIVLGHEVAGLIKKLGRNVSGFKIGDAVTLALLMHPVSERINGAYVGLSFDGGYGQYVVAPQKILVKIPDGISFAQAAVATDALATSYHAVVGEAGARPGLTMGIVGLGGLGMHGLQFAALKESTVYCFDVNEYKFVQAKAYGAKDCFASLDDATDAGVAFDVIVDFVGHSTTTSAAIRTVNPGGRVITVGLASSDVTIPSNTGSGYILKGLTIVGSIGASMQDLKDVLALLAEGKIKPELTEVAFEEIPETIKQLAEGTVAGRVWTDPSKTLFQ
ncbi:alcohol dehydrogenase like domain protein [Fusarium tjaetaba]|uniref:Alcohol dehydrogenase like domain protein n=1 Tax=Fusarium tjaetaba TaxID=1567544 RepID=A0A8H5R7E9_9HYPO|nr:alcohol dehydrogenase like domain protein [Fusarium tjaetaba]KAF5626781.1 alcohol dehydrogenase like domain protein [Fusarium tjaetaba]